MGVILERQRARMQALAVVNVHRGDDPQLGGAFIKHGQRCASYTGAHTYEVRQIAFTHDDSELTSADIIHAKRWNSRAPDEAASEWRVVSDLAGTATGSGGSAAFAVLSDGRLGQWLLSAGREFRPLPATGTQLSAWKGVAVAAEAWRAFAWGDTGLAVWDLSKERPLGSIAASDVKAAAISADGRCIVRAEGSQVIGWWPDSGRTQIIGRYGSGETPRALAITPDGRRVISCAFDRSAKVWALDPDADEPSQLAYRYISTREKPNSVHCLSDHAAVITTGSGELLLFDPQDDSPSGVQLLDGRHEAFVSTLLPFGDGMRFATSSGDRSIRLWDLFSGECTNVFRQHPGHLQQLSLATGRMLATTFAGELKVLSLEDGSLIAAFQADKQIISAVADSDLRSITAVDQGGGLHFLRLETP